MKVLMISIYIVILPTIALGQTPFNHSYRDTTAFITNEMLYETPDHYISIGYYDPFTKVGVHVQKYDKKTGALVFRDVFYHGNSWLFTHGRSRIYDTGESIKFAIAGSVFIFQLEFNYFSNELSVADTVINHEGVYLNDFEIFSDYTIYYAGSGNKPGWHIKNNDGTIKLVLLSGDAPRNACQHFIKSANGNYIFFGGKNDGANNKWRIAVTEIDQQGNKIWERETTNNASYSVEDIMPINEYEILILADSDALDPVIKDKGFYHILYHFDLRTKTIKRLRTMSEPCDYFGTYGDLERSQRDSNTYFVCTGTWAEGSRLDSLFSVGRIVKIKADGSPIWTKDYHYKTVHESRNTFNAMIPLSDGNYLIGGELAGDWIDGWLVKIDEDGNILPIDTTSSAVNQDISPAILEIKVYPNPASHSIIINQGEITGMTYQLIDMSGEVVKTLPMPHAHHNTIWDISEVPVGNYILKMLQGGKVIGTKQVVIIE